MRCPECESFDEFVYPETVLYLLFPLVHSFEKAQRLVSDGGYKNDAVGDSGLRIELNGNALDRLLIPLQGELTSQELATAKAMAMPRGTSPTVENLLSVVPLDTLIALSQGRWLRDLVEAERYETHFQPIVDARLGSIAGYEALFRGQEKDGSIISPGHIFQIAGDAGLLFQVDLAARRSAVESAASAGMKNKWLFVNFNPTAVYDPSYCLRTTVSNCHALGLDPASIVFEVTETDQVSDIQHLKGILSFYRKAGFRVALDDIGAGYSGLNVLQELNPDIIKIDQHLVRDIDSDRFRRSIVDHLISMAHENNIRVVAEGIETEAELACVTELGADLLQGYLLGRPAAAPVDQPLRSVRA